MNPDVGDILTGDIATITNNGYGAIKKPGRERGYITIGPVDCNKGSTVQVKYLGGEDEYNAAYGLCLTKSARTGGYEEFVESIHDQLLANRPPEVDEITVARIERIEDGIGYVSFPEREICIGPVNADVGDLIEIEGVTDSHARVRSSANRGDDYEIRFKILAGMTRSLPLSVGDEFKSPITEIKEDAPIAYVNEVPIRFPDADVARAQVIRGRIAGFGTATVLGEVTEITDEVRHISDAGQWARIHWLQESGFGDDAPLHEFAAQFIGLDESRLPEDADNLQAALVAEAIRLGLQSNITPDGAHWSKVHIMSLRYWVERKLSALFGEPEGEDDWFREVLTDGSGPTLTFLGDLTELREGYYTPGQTRAIMTNPSEAVLISGFPTREFLRKGFDIDIRGASRLIADTTKDALDSAGIPVQEQAQYLGFNRQDGYDVDYLIDFIESRSLSSWSPAPEWDCYVGNRGYGFDWESDPLEISLGERVASFWRYDPERDRPEYWLKIDFEEADESAQMINVPNRIWKQVCLILDAESDRPRRVEMTPLDEGIRLSCDFPPPGSQIRWLHAIGAQFEDPDQGFLHWRVQEGHRDSVCDAFDPLAIDTADAT